MNKVILSGNLCKDIELKYTTTNNKPVVQNSIAVRNDFKNQNGDYESQFINIVVWNKTAEFLSQYASKGSKILVEGRLTNRSYDKQDGTKGYITEVVVEKIELLNTKKQETSETQEDTQDTTQEPEYNDPFAEYGETVELDDNFLD